MALFKIHKGQKVNLPQTKNEGYAYVTTDEAKMYIDISDNERIVLNANKADNDSNGSPITGYVKNVANAVDGDIEVTFGNGTTKKLSVASGTTYEFAEGTVDGKFAVTPDGGTTQYVPVHGLKSAAYTESTDYSVVNIVRW